MISSATHPRWPGRISRASFRVTSRRASDCRLENVSRTQVSTLSSQITLAKHSSRLRPIPQLRPARFVSASSLSLRPPQLGRLTVSNSWPVARCCSGAQAQGRSEEVRPVWSSPEESAPTRVESISRTPVTDVWSATLPHPTMSEWPRTGATLLDQRVHRGRIFSGPW